MLGCLGKRGAALAQRRLGAEFLAHLLDLLGHFFPLRLFRADQLIQRHTLGAQLFVLPLDLHFLKPAQIAQPHVEDGVRLHVGKLEALHQDRLRLVLVADDPDDPVEVEIGNEIAP